jgi:hypothetical protein
MRIRAFGLIAAALLVATPALAYDDGEWVLARWKGGDHWYPGVVAGSSDGRVKVRFDDGDVDTMPTRDVRPYSWRAGSRVECNWKGGGTWYKGRIVSLGAENLRVDYDDGDTEKTKTGMCRSR